MINEKRLVDLFVEYAKIDSESGNEKAMCDRVCADLTALGLKVEKTLSEGSNGYNIYVKVPGTKEGAPLLMSAHVDTVVPGNGIRPRIEGGIIRSEGDTILSADDKSGVAGVLEALKSLKEDGEAHREIEIIFSVGEEVGLLGAKNFKNYHRLDSKIAYILDGAGHVGTVILNAPYAVKLEAEIRGRSAHAGIEPEKGISAIWVMSKAIANMTLLRIDAETTCNIGKVVCDSPTNIVPDKASMLAEVRGATAEKMEAQIAHMRECLEKACEEAGAELTFNVISGYTGFRVSEDDEAVCILKRALSEIGCEYEVAHGCGGCDGNVMAQNGITPVILSIGMQKVHSTEEFIEITDLVKTAKLVEALAKD